MTLRPDTHSLGIRQQLVK